jgi:Zn-dependent peptidase ImmA (M78 family)
MVFGAYALFTAVIFRVLLKNRVEISEDKQKLEEFKSKYQVSILMLRLRGE